MPRTRSLAWSELKIGILAIVALVVAVTVIFMLSGEGGLFWQRYSLKTRFPDVAGLKTGAPVRVAGVEVGSVTDVTFVGAAVEVVMQVSRTMQPRLTSESVASLGSLTLLGEGVIDLTASMRGQPIPEWGYVRSWRGSGRIGDVADAAAKGLEEATRLIQDVRRGQGTVGRLFTDEALYREIYGFVGAAEEVASQLSRGQGTLGKLVSDPGAYEALEGSLRNLDAITRRINAGQGTLGRLLHEDALATSLTSATRRIDAVAGKLDQGEGTAGKLVNDATLYNRLNAFADRLDQLTARLNQGEGTVGQLLRDEQLYENMNGAASELRRLVGDIRKDPKRYLNVKISIF